MSNPEIPFEDNMRGSADISGNFESIFVEELIIAERDILHSEIREKVETLKPYMVRGLGFFRFITSDEQSSVFVANDQVRGSEITTIISNTERHSIPGEASYPKSEVNTLSRLILTDDPALHHASFETIHRLPVSSWPFPVFATLIELQNGVVRFIGNKRPDYIAPAKVDSNVISDVELQIRTYDYTLDMLKRCNQSSQETGFRLETPWYRI